MHLCMDVYIHLPACGMVIDVGYLYVWVGHTHKYLMGEGVGLNNHWLNVFIKLMDMYICI